VSLGASAIVLPTASVGVSHGIRMIFIELSASGMVAVCRNNFGPALALAETAATTAPVTFRKATINQEQCSNGDSNTGYGNDIAALAIAVTAHIKAVTETTMQSGNI